MKIQLLSSTIDDTRRATEQQHLACFVIDDRVAIDAGSLSLAASDAQRQQIRDIILTHSHLDHIAGLPLFIDDLFATLKEPINIHSTKEVTEALEAHIFNWVIYPRFSELMNDNGPVLKYLNFRLGSEFEVAHLRLNAIEVNHKVQSAGFIISDGKKRIAFTGDTSEMDHFWDVINGESTLDGLFIECAFPDELAGIAETSHHLTPQKLAAEVAKFTHDSCPVYVINMKPMYREKIIGQLEKLQIKNLKIFPVGIPQQV